MEHPQLCVQVQQLRRDEKFKEIEELCNRRIQAGEVTKEVFEYRSLAQDTQNALKDIQKAKKVQNATKIIALKESSIRIQAKDMAKAYIQLGQIEKAREELFKKKNISSQEIDILNVLSEYTSAIKNCNYIKCLYPSLIPIHCERQTIEDSLLAFLDKAKMLFEKSQQQNNPVFQAAKYLFFSQYFKEQKKTLEEAWNLTFKVLKEKKWQDILKMNSDVLKQKSIKDDIQEAILNYQLNADNFETMDPEKVTSWQFVDTNYHQNKVLFIIKIGKIFRPSQIQKNQDEKKQELFQNNKMQKLEQNQGEHHQRLQQLEHDVSELKEGYMNIKKDLSFLHSAVKDIKKQIKPEEEVFVEIEKLNDESNKKFFKALYPIILQNFIFFRLAQDDRFKQNPQAYNNVDKVLTFVSFFQPAKFYPLGEQLQTTSIAIKAGFVILDKYRSWRIEKVHGRIGKMISKVFIGDTKLNLFISHSMIMLIKNEEFVSELTQGIQNYEKYLESIWGKLKTGMVLPAKSLLFEGTKNTNFSLTDEIATIHGALIAQMLYEVENEDEFQQKTKDMDIFGNWILKTLLVGQRNANQESNCYVM